MAFGRVAMQHDDRKRRGKMISLRHAARSGISIVKLATRCTQRSSFDRNVTQTFDVFCCRRGLIGTPTALVPSLRILDVGEDDAGRPGARTLCGARTRASTEEGRRIAAAYHSQSSRQHVHLRDSPMRRLPRLGKDKNLVGVAEARNDDRHWAKLTRDRCRFAASERSAT
jgi:hypothetical protein